ncbi:glutathione S-transferase [Tepidimonas taiwanensis]|uniref:glutathione transferase n=1 Tax=Tepidimonas taiwanensis TaxID=307486 RepID=A0A554XBQ9_9BURK|nr:glutathione S-transferase [Tepidimonas taiwanensis]MCX7692128.1 glutathione S-transferase [Tepidimonas taiwanensis]MDM7463605.1 glutathione S-transferase [Tepidimonas taiwanensis]TSE33281.1 maiA: maleylacetoacetate isomerase [Tepidimonas taiwanensis]UBQ04325.1 glutathione S-transferase [Tepidimonas taiwanensis]
MSTVVVHHLEHSRSQRVLWLLEELGVPYELRRYARDPRTRLAPPELKAVHPLGKSPVITHGDITVAESAAILEYLVETFPPPRDGDLAGLLPPPGSAAHRANRFWLHFAEGSLMNWLVMKLVFVQIPRQRMPFFARPVARAISQQVLQRLVDPNIDAALELLEQTLSDRPWLTGEHLALADFQMSFAIEAAVARSGSQTADRYPHLSAYRARYRARPAYQRALAKGGPEIMKI